MIKCTVCNSTNGCTSNLLRKFDDGIVRGRIPNTAPKCSDCGVRAQRCHHVGCPQEKCPKCHKFLIECKCTTNLDRAAIFQELARQALAAEQSRNFLKVASSFFDCTSNLYELLLEESTPSKEIEKRVSKHPLSRFYTILLKNLSYSDSTYVEAKSHIEVLADVV